MTALYSTEPVIILGTKWRYAINGKGRGAFQYLCNAHLLTHRREFWFEFECYNHKQLGLVTLAELNAALYAPNREAIARARDTCYRMAVGYNLAPHMEAMQFNLI